MPIIEVLEIKIITIDTNGYNFILEQCTTYEKIT